MKEIKRIAILTSGGDAPGMNKTIHTLVDYAQKYNFESYVIYNGYKGLYNNEIEKADLNLISTQSNQAGSCIFSSRFPEMKKPEVVDVCVKNLKEHQIDLLYVLGGNGSFKGAREISKKGVDVMCIPCTIDNDVEHTEYTIGFDSALNVCVDAIDQLRATSETHGNTMIVEIMGRNCSDLTIASSLATSVDYVITQHNIKSKEELAEIINKIKKHHKKKSIIILTSELIYNGGEGNEIKIQELRAYLEAETSIRTKYHIVGFVQRGAHPTAIERFNASRMARYSIELAMKGKVNKAIGVNGKEMISTDINSDFDRKEDIERINKAINLVNRIDHI